MPGTIIIMSCKYLYRKKAAEFSDLQFSSEAVSKWRKRK